MAIHTEIASLTNLHPCFHGLHGESGEGRVEVHLERHCLRADPVEGTGVVIASADVQTIVTAGTCTSTLHGERKMKKKAVSQSSKSHHINN